MASSRHLWVGGLPEEMDEAAIKEYFSKYGKIEGVKILPQRYPNIGLAAFIDFLDVKSAIEAKEAKHKIGSTELRTNFKTKTAEKFEPSARKEGGKWHDGQGEGEKHESTKSEKSRGHESSSSSSDSASSSSSSSSDSESEGEGSKKRGTKKGGSDGGPLFIKVTSLASNRPERVLQDGLYYEFTRHSPNVMVRMYGEPDKTYAIVKFRKTDECKSAYKEAQGIVLFGSKIKLTLLDKDDFPPGGRDQARFHPGPGGGPMGSVPHPFPQEELDPQATRSLFVGNIPKNINVYELRDIFQRFGNVLDVEIKKMSGNATYGFVLFYDLMDAVRAKQCMDGDLIRGNKIRVGFGKGTASKTLWVDGIDPTMDEGQLERHMTKFGKVIRLGVDRLRHCAMVQFDTIDNAKDAINSVKGSFIGSSKRIMADFANRDAKAAFFSRLESGEHPGPPRGFPSGPGGMYNPGMNPRGGMMIPRGGMPMMGMGRGGFPPHGPPMDYFYPYMEEGMGYYGGRPPFHGPGPMGMRRFSHGHGPFEEGFDDYEDELRAFSRKREWEKEREKRKERKKRKSTSSEGEGSDSEDSSSRRKKKSKEKEKKKSSKKEKDKKSREKSTDKSEGETDSGEEQKREEVRLRATQRSRDLREKLKKKGRKKPGKEAKSDGEASSEGEDSSSEKEAEVKKPSRKDKERGREKERAKDRDREKSKPSKKKDDETAKSSSRKKKPKTPDSPPPEKHPKKKKREKVSEKEPKESESEGEKEPKESESEGEKENGREPKTPPPQVENGEEEVREKVKSPELEETKVVEEIPVDEPAMEDGKPVEESPQSPSPQSSTPRSPTPLGKKSSEEESTSKQKLESDLSSGEDFRDEEMEPMEVKEATPPPREGEKSIEPTVEEPRENIQKVEATNRKRTGKKERSPKPKSPDSEGSETEKRSTTPPTKKPQRADEEIEEKPSSDSEARRSRKLPRQYKLEEEERRERQREPKDHRHPKRHPLPPTTPSPPPAFASHGHRRRHHFSPPHPEYFERRWHRRGRYHSPGPYGHRRYSRSPPPGYPPSPPHRPRSPYSGSPPPPRARTPIQRPGRERGGPRYRFESPPYDAPRGKYQRRGSPPSPPHRHYSPSPPLRPHSPGRRHARHRSRTPSPPPRRSPVHRRERSRSTESGRSSPHYPDDRYDSRRHIKRPPRSPSPKGKHREPMKEDYPEPKRRRVEETRPKSPSGTPPPPREDTKPSRPEKSHPPPQPSASGGYSEAPPPSSQRYRGSHGGGEAEYGHQGRQQQATQPQPQGQQASYRQGATEHARGSQPVPGGVVHGHAHQAAPPNPQQADNLLDLLRRYPVMWQGHLMLKNDSAAVQLHFLSGNVTLAKLSLPQPSEQHTPCLRIAQRMRLEQTQLEGVHRRIQNDGEHCLLLALPCGRDANDVRAQTHALKNSLISYLLQKQAAGIINVQGPQTGFVLHIFPPCPFSQGHLSRVAPDLLSSASDNCHLMIVVATM